MCGFNQQSNDINESNYNMQPITIQFTVGYVRTIWISRENNIIQIDLRDGSVKLSTKRKRTESPYHRKQTNGVDDLRFGPAPIR